MADQTEIKAHCSWCFKKSIHTHEGTNRLGRAFFKCQKCENRTVVCMVPTCYEMARGEGKVDDVFCAAHAGEIGGFKQLDLKLAEIDEYPNLFKREVKNLGRASKIAAWAGSSALVFGPAAFFAAPAIGGAIGSSVFGLSGAAAVSKGLATLGLGAVSAGGMGMTGGIALVTASGAAVGSTVGGVVANAYMGVIDGFKIKRLQDGKGPSVMVINGFLTKGDKKQEYPWLYTLHRHYPKNPWYLVEWEAKRLRDLGTTAMSATSMASLLTVLTSAAKKATFKGAGLLAPIDAGAVMINLAKNPWHVAMTKAAPTGNLLAEIIARIPARKKYILLGHSLGARVIFYCLQTLSGQQSQRIKTAHLLGGAIGTGKPSEWEKAASSVSGVIHNYYSKNDEVLRTLFNMGRAFLGTPAIGRNKIRSKALNIVNHDVTELVSGHNEFKQASNEFLVR